MNVSVRLAENLGAAIALAVSASGGSESSIASGKGLKAHDWFVIPVSSSVHREYHTLGVETWEAKYGTHADLLKKFWKQIGFQPGEWMTEGMRFRRAEVEARARDALDATGKVPEIFSA